MFLALLRTVTRRTCVSGSFLDIFFVVYCIKDSIINKCFDDSNKLKVFRVFSTILYLSCNIRLVL